MKYQRTEWVSSFGKFTKMILLWVMLISGIVLVTQQARASITDDHHSVAY
jgi:hypothetical protein